MYILTKIYNKQPIFLQIPFYYHKIYIIYYCTQNIINTFPINHFEERKKK